MKYLLSVSGILLFEDKILMLKRNSNLSAFGGYYAFVGGKIHEDETLLEGLCREVKEELRMDIKHSAKIQYIGMAKTPHFQEVKYQTHFYVIELKEKPEIILNPQDPLEEHTDFAWKTPLEWLTFYQTGNVLLVPVSLKILEYLSNENNFSQEIDFSYVYNDSKEVPLLYPIDELGILLVPSVTFPPANATNCILLNDVMIDPSPKDIPTMEKVLFTVQNKYAKKINKIIITHHHPDHHQFSVNMAKALNIPIFLSEQTFYNITQLQENYFKGIEHSFLKENQVITHYKGNEVFCMHTPGHDNGQFSFYDSQLRFFVASDLFQTQGTVVIPLKEGCLLSYLESLDKVMQLNPKVLIPSHGLCVGGVSHLLRTKNHRLHRHEQIKKCVDLKMDIDQMLELLYKNLNPELVPLAKMNILSHLKAIQR